MCQMLAFACSEEFCRGVTTSITTATTNVKTPA